MSGRRKRVNKKEGREAKIAEKGRIEEERDG